MTPTEFLAAHQANQNTHALFTDLPFYRWLTAQEPPPERLTDALFEYYAGHKIRGAFSEEEITNYRYIYNEFWRARHQREENRRISEESRTRGKDRQLSGAT